MQYRRLLCLVASVIFIAASGCNRTFPAISTQRTFFSQPSAAAGTFTVDADYLGNSIYPSVQAIRCFVPSWSQRQLKVVLDLHCPHISGKYNEVIYIVGSSTPATWQQQKEFTAVLESVCEEPLPYRAESSLPFGTAWNTAENYGEYKSCGRWGAEQLGIRLATTIEIPYANVGVAVVTSDNARTFGHDLARALWRYLESGNEQSGINNR